MDPNTCLTHLRAMAQYLLKQLDNGEDVALADVDELASMVENLDTWICDGGFLPTDWSGTGD